MLRLILITVALNLLAACSAPIGDLKSPCVGTDGSPCDRRPVNGHSHPENG